MKNNSLAFNLIIIILISIVWALVIPGYVAYKNEVFYGWQLKKIPSEDLLKGRLLKAHDNITFYKIYSDSVVQISKEKPVTKVTFAGFADVGLNYVWVSSYVLLSIFIFI